MLDGFRNGDRCVEGEEIECCRWELWPQNKRKCEVFIRVGEPTPPEPPFPSVCLSAKTRVPSSAQHPARALAQLFVESIVSNAKTFDPNLRPLSFFLSAAVSRSGEVEFTVEFSGKNLR